MTWANEMAMIEVSANDNARRTEIIQSDCSIPEIRGLELLKAVWADWIGVRAIEALVKEAGGHIDAPYTLHM